MKTTKLTTALIVILACACIGLFGCDENVCAPTAWIGFGPDIDAPDDTVQGRVGIRNVNGLEFGGESRWMGKSGDNQSFGVYLMQEIPVIEQLGAQYLGAGASVYDTEDGQYYGFFVGQIFPISGNMDSYIEYRRNHLDGSWRQQIGSDEENVYTAGIRVKF